VPPGGKGMPLDQILALARRKMGEAAPAAAAAPPPPAASQTASRPAPPKPAPPAPPPAPEPAVEESQAAAEEPRAAVATESPTSGEPVRSLKDQITSVADQIAYCRKVDRNRKGS